jgi:hypothetical protein
MSYNGSGTFNINSTGQPVVAGTVITASAFNALTTDLATGLTTAITKDGQTTTTARITFAQGITSSLVTDSSSVSTGSIITDGGVGIAKNLYVGGTLNVTGSTSLTNPVINNIKMGYTTTATAAGTTTLTVASNYRQFFTGSTTQTIVLPVTSTLVTGMAYEIENNSTGLLTVNSSGGNLVGTIPAGVCAHAVCIGTTLTTAADWDWDYISTTTITGTGANVLGTSPTITTPTISSLSSASATALTLQSAGTTAVTIDTSQNVLVGTTTTTNNLRNGEKLAVVTTGGNQGGASLTTYYGTGAAGGVILDLQRSRGTTDGSMTAVASGDTLGYLLFRGSDGTSFQDSSYISGQVDGAVSGGTVPGRLAFITSGSERMRIDSLGNFFVGKTAYNDTSGNGFGVFPNSGVPQVSCVGASNSTNKNFTVYSATDSAYKFYVDYAGGGYYAGNLLVGTTSSTPAGSGDTKGIALNSSGSSSQIYATGNGDTCAVFNRAASDGATVRLRRQGSDVGSISVTASATAYNTSSDYRLKDNVQPMTGALAKVALLKPVTYKWKVDGSDGEGFIAHELAEVKPDCVSGDKDATREEQYEVTPAVKDEEGNITTPAVMGIRTVPVYQGIDTSFLIATLTAAIQELSAKNDALTARIVALENA